MSAEAPALVASPFHPDKLALHGDRVAALAVGEMIAPQTIEVDLTDGFCNQGCTHCCFGSNQLQPMQQIDPEAFGCSYPGERRHSILHPLSQPTGNEGGQYPRWLFWRAMVWAGAC